MASMKEICSKEKDEAAPSEKISRLDFIKKISWLAAGFYVGCSPIKILFQAYPDKFKHFSPEADEILRHFVVTVIPGAPVDSKDLTKIFYDEYYPFHAYTGFFVSDLAQRAKDLFGTDGFAGLSPDHRTKVIQDGLNADGTTAKLYRGAMYLARVSFYGGIYHDEEGCPLIGFPGANSGFPDDEIFYPRVEQHLADALTASGNYS